MADDERIIEITMKLNIKSTIGRVFCLFALFILRSRSRPERPMRISYCNAPRSRACISSYLPRYIKPGIPLVSNPKPLQVLLTH
jgi:hypothetical protein